MQKIVLFNNKCPVCSAEIRHYENIASNQDAGIKFEGIFESGGALKLSGLSEDEACRRLHVVSEDGSSVSGVDAFILIWSKLNPYKWLAWIIRKPFIKPVANFIYEKILAPFLFYKELSRRKSNK